MGNSKARISERITKPNKKPRRKDGPQHQHLLSFQHEERLWRFLLQQQMEQRLDGLQQEPRQPVQGVQELVQQGGGQGGGGQHQVGGLRAIRKTSRGRKARGEEGGRQRLHPEELLKELHPAQGGGADKMVSNLSSEGILVITTPKSAPALTDATHEAK